MKKCFLDINNRECTSWISDCIEYVNIFKSSITHSCIHRRKRVKHGVAINYCFKISQRFWSKHNYDSTHVDGMILTTLCIQTDIIYHVTNHDQVYIIIRHIISWNILPYEKSIRISFIVYTTIYHGGDQLPHINVAQKIFEKLTFCSKIITSYLFYYFNILLNS